jgi:hypothetical protein
MMEPSVEQDPDKTAALVALAEQAVAEEGPGDEVRRFSILGTALCWQYKHNPNVDVLRKAVDAYRVAAGAVPRADPFGDTMLSIFTGLLILLYRDDGDLAALEEALDISTERVGRSGTAESWRRLEELLKLASDTDVKESPGYRRAAKARSQALAAMASDGAQLTEQALESGDPEAAAAVVRLLKKALSEAEGTDQAQRGQWQFNLGRAHAAVWQLTRDAEARTSAIDAFLGAIAIGLPDRLRAAGYLNLAFAYAQRYNGADGLLDDLDAAVMALELTAPPDDAPELTRECQQSLQYALWNRYMATADLADLERAIQIARSLLAGGRPAGKSRKAAHLTRREDTAELRRLLLEQQAFRVDARVSSEIAALSRALGDSSVPDPEAELLGWSRTYD